MNQTPKYFSPSAIATAEGCIASWYHQYLGGRRAPPTKANEFGSRGHAIYERYYRGLDVDWSGPVGSVAAHALHTQLPYRESVHFAHPERAIGGAHWPGWVLLRPDGDVEKLTSEGIRSDEKPGMAVLIDGAPFAGFLDLTVALTHAEIDRIGAQHVRGTAGILLVDYKFTSDLKYAKDVATLDQDTAAALYVLDSMLRYGVTIMPCRWSYAQTRGAHREKPVDFVISKQRAYDILGSKVPLIRKLQTIRDVKDAPCNPDACYRYNQMCYQHVSRGGACQAEQRVSIAMPRFGDSIMAKTADQIANEERLKNLFAKSTVTPPPADDAELEDAEDEATDESAEAEEAPPPPVAEPPKPPPVRKPRAPKASPVAEPPAPELVRPATVPPPAPVGVPAPSMAGLAENYAALAELCRRAVELAAAADELVKVRSEIDRLTAMIDGLRGRA